jgi:hypothetical protein
MTRKDKEIFELQQKLNNQTLQTLRYYTEIQKLNKAIERKNKRIKTLKRKVLTKIPLDKTVKTVKPKIKAV